VISWKVTTQLVELSRILCLPPTNFCCHESPPSSTFFQQKPSNHSTLQPFERLTFFLVLFTWNQSQCRGQKSDRHFFLLLIVRTFFFRRREPFLHDIHRYVPNLTTCLYNSFRSKIPKSTPPHVFTLHSYNVYTKVHNQVRHTKNSRMVRNTHSRAICFAGLPDGTKNNFWVIFDCLAIKDVSKFSGH
jgi:hypothetical protein